MVARPAHLAGLAVDQLRRELRGDVAQPPLAQLQPLLMGAERALPGRGQPVRGGRRLRRERITAPCRFQLSASRFQPARQLFGAGRGLLRRFDAFLKATTGGFPAREPAFRFQDQFVVGPGLPLQFGPLGVDLRAAPFGPTRGVEAAELLP